MLDRSQFRRGLSLGRKLLHGVGTGELFRFVTEPQGIALHVQRRLSARELSALSPAWLAIPARDERGPCKDIG